MKPAVVISWYNNIYNMYKLQDTIVNKYNMIYARARKKLFTAITSKSNELWDTL